MACKDCEKKKRNPNIKRIPSPSIKEKKEIKEEIAEEKEQNSENIVNPA